MIVNFAERAHNHNWELDPVIRSLLDTDFYKLLMLQFIWKHFPNTRVYVFAASTGIRAVRIADIVRHRRVKVSCNMCAAALSQVGTGLAGGQYVLWAPRNFRAGVSGVAGTATSACRTIELSVQGRQFHLTFDGSWTETTMWELYALAILDELKTRAQLKTLSEFGLDILYARAKTKLWRQDRTAARRPRI